ncbi:MAG: RNA methyltransferase [Planctomycetota bacterium]
MLEQVHVVLLRPRWARNLGSVARAMKNFGLQRLSIVESQIGSWNDAWQMAVHADDVLDAAVQTEDLEATLAEASWVVGTTNNPPKSVRVMTPREVAEEALRRGPPTLLFGGEINGLDPAELLRCHAVSVVPTAPAQSSLNLAQAVCVYGAELFAACRQAETSDAPVEVAASTELMQRLEKLLEHALSQSQWAKANRPKNAIGQLMQPFYRAGLTESEVHAWLSAMGKIWRPKDAEY